MKTYEIRYIERVTKVYQLQAENFEAANEHMMDDLELVDEFGLDCAGPFIVEIVPEPNEV